MIYETCHSICSKLIYAGKEYFPQIVLLWKPGYQLHPFFNGNFLMWIVILHQCFSMYDWWYATIGSESDNADYCQTSNIRCTLVGNKIGQRQLQDEMRNIEVLGFDAPYIRGLTVSEKPYPEVMKTSTKDDSGHISLYSPYKPCNHSLYTGWELVNTILRWQESNRTILQC